MENFSDNIKDWVVLDNQIKHKLNEIKILRSQRNELSELILNFTKRNQLYNKKIIISDGNLTFNTHKTLKCML